MFLSIYRVYIIKEYIRVTKEKVRKVVGKVRCGKECFPYIDIVYNSIIEIRKRKVEKGQRYVHYIYRTLIQT